MSNLIISGSIGGIVVIIVYFIGQYFFLPFVNKFIDYLLTKRTISYKSQLQAKHQEQQHLHEFVYLNFRI